MPIYEYVARDRPGCSVCTVGFDVLQRLADPTLTVCPHCAVPIQRVITAPSVVSGQAHVLDEKNVAKNGFTQYRRIGKGKYEKTAGRGPSTISSD